MDILVEDVVDILGYRGGIEGVDLSAFFKVFGIFISRSFSLYMKIQNFLILTFLKLKIIHIAF